MHYLAQLFSLESTVKRGLEVVRAYILVLFLNTIERLQIFNNKYNICHEFLGRFFSMGLWKLPYILNLLRVYIKRVDISMFFCFC